MCTELGLENNNRNSRETNKKLTHVSISAGDNMISMKSLISNINDNAWHHTALTIEYGGNLVFEVDGYPIVKPLSTSIFNFEGMY